MESQLYFDDVLPWCREAETLKGSGIRWQNPPASGIKSDCGCLSISTCLPTMHFSGMRPSKFKVKMSDAFFSAIIKKDLSTSTLPIHGLIWALSAPRRASVQMRLDTIRIVTPERSAKNERALIFGAKTSDAKPNMDENFVKKWWPKVGPRLLILY